MHVKLPLMSFVLVLSMAACNTTSIWYGEGQSVSRSNADLLNCRVDAANRVPVNTQVGVTPIVQSPVRTTCVEDKNGKVTCRSRGGTVSGGKAYSFDANADLREDVIAQCMAKRGFQKISLPVCTQSDSEKYEPYSKFPKVSDGSCVAKTDTGGWVVVNPS